MSSRSRGREHEKRFAELLERAGWFTQRAPLASRAIGPGRFVTYHADYLGYFDIIGVRQRGEVAFVQVTTSTTTGHHASDRRRKIVAFVQERMGFSDKVRVLLACWNHTNELRYHFTVELLLGGKKWARIGAIKNDGSLYPVEVWKYLFEEILALAEEKLPKVEVRHEEREPVAKPSPPPPAPTTGPLDKWMGGLRP